MAAQDPKLETLPLPARRAFAPRPVAERPAEIPLKGPTESALLAAKVTELEDELEKLRALMRDLEAHAERDPLTELFNRRGFEREIGRVLAYLRRYGGGAALVFLDLDRFKPVNDGHGHAAGDAMLKAVAAALVEAVRASDTVARIGGDEFAVLLRNLSPEAATSKAMALEQSVATVTIPWGAATLAVGATAGVATLTAADSPEDILARADERMYARKRERRA